MASETHSIANITGTDNADTLQGSEFDDTISAQGGDVIPTPDVVDLSNVDAEVVRTGAEDGRINSTTKPP